jgi:hypothetical protein
MALEFAQFRANGCKLLVAGRRDPQSDRFLQLSDIEVPPELSDLLLPIPESDFRVDLSSTALRQRGMGLEGGSSGSSGSSSSGSDHGRQ